MGLLKQDKESKNLPPHVGEVPRSGDGGKHARPGKAKNLPPDVGEDRKAGMGAHTI